MALDQAISEATEMSHEAQILQHMKVHDSITGLQALKLYGCFRLPARIYDLRMKGHPIEAQKWKTRSGKTVARYWLSTKKPA
ncbi:unnamed protein product [marine sediment metagenome]|uniref:Winged helix-turn-helix domain-containing protein n=1 Tax=marine sediment metagenome TaxID=412755 RepID=X1NKB4_9ZZZZ